MPRPKIKPGGAPVPPPPPMDAPSFGAALAAWREAAGYSQAGLAEVLGCNQSQLARWETETRAPGPQLAYLALREGRLDFLIRAQIGALERRLEIALALQGRFAR